ncbi:AbrB/MazE/SpoVT family DNA-binding domain-containing protein [Paenibacillus filicis]|uniref:AbrB/MazE/SpoVT family DNA-binding domain-containing protein n=1 Tax=Paenibacillus gyeongsangnamensis TaxID=3388067 RepID=A0ABT4Q920_9BACL|nr:AbrB/MazE/SpoVT family DNA-binding domain-containing protein [Paenibacillus filicis]MCZ8513379.1 AbrB/MazE/SpoVT family DNA-binding domain-containing protein [Paenibacillus filicis]
MVQNSTGVVRNLDALGRVVIPKEIRHNFSIENNDPVEMYIDGEKIAVKKYAPGCIFCGSLEALITFHNKLVCKSCANEAQK